MCSLRCSYWFGNDTVFPAMLPYSIVILGQFVLKCTRFYWGRKTKASKGIQRHLFFEFGRHLNFEHILYCVVFGQLPLFVFFCVAQIIRRACPVWQMAIAYWHNELCFKHKHYVHANWSKYRDENTHNYHPDARATHRAKSSSNKQSSFMAGSPCWSESCSKPNTSSWN